MNDPHIKLSCAATKFQQQLKVAMPVSFALTERSSSSVEIRIKDISISLAIVYFHEVIGKKYLNVNAGNFKCLNVKRRSFVISNLQEHQTYTFCLIKSDANTTSPFNCKPFLRQTDNDWLTKKDKTRFVVIVLICLVVTAFVGVTIMYITLWMDPTLLKRNKHVIIVGQRTADKIKIENKTDFEETSSNILKPNNGNSTIPEIDQALYMTPVPIEANEQLLVKKNDFYRNIFI
jgi:hypothetical protein